MSLPVFFQSPAVESRLPRGGRRTTLADLCRQAGIPMRVTGLGARRPIYVSSAPRLAAVRMPGKLGPVWVAAPGSAARRSLLVLGVLAYAVFDYGARECLRGRPEARAAAGPGRPLVPRPLSVAERQRRHRSRGHA